MSLESEMANAFKELNFEMGSMWNIGGRSLRAIQEDFPAGLEYELEGLIAIGEFRLSFPKSDFGNQLPSAGSTVTNEATQKQYRILRVVTSQGDPTVSLECGSMNQ